VSIFFRCPRMMQGNAPASRLKRAIFRALLRASLALEKDFGPRFLAHLPYQRLPLSRKLRLLLNGLSNSSYNMEGRPVRDVIRGAFTHLPPDDTLGLEAVRQLGAMQAAVLRAPPLPPAERSARFSTGDVVLHHDTGRAGIVLSHTLFCKKSRQWILRNIGALDEPFLDLPWYVVLAEGSQLIEGPEQAFAMVTRRHLDADSHWVKFFFESFNPQTGRYVPRRVVRMRWLTKKAVRKGRVTLLVRPDRQEPVVPPAPVVRRGRLRVKKSRFQKET